MTCACEQLYEDIEASISQVTKASEQILANPSSESHSTAIEIKFYEETKTKNDGFLGSLGAFWQKEAKSYWEIWVLFFLFWLKQIIIKQHTSDVDLRVLEKEVRENMIKIIDFANKYMDHLPKLPNIETLKDSPVSYPFEIKNPDQKDNGGFGAFKMLLKTPPIKT
ncbi:hypothetical protein RFI_25976 [Reticulomyxa filosa]|uniref:Autophagy-related protein 101 n=1 Tax=Reticulomyxa filosa TaxID=46433 RepID=X6MCP1_RETFI|nr:hypothetical protein RFI_25976 [Reticulomyxa filosa]|eukprot:ETO11401.1 hypothetical protein RFI_25976 [Reticulomyxa filosa]